MWTMYGAITYDSDVEADDDAHNGHGGQDGEVGDSGKGE